MQLGFPESTEPSHSDTLSPAALVIRSEFANLPAMLHVLHDYIAGLPRGVVMLHQFLDEGRRADLHRVAHQLRGSGGSFGFPEITRLAIIVEEVIDTERPHEQVAEDVRALIALLRCVEGYNLSAEVSIAPTN